MCLNDNERPEADFNMCDMRSIIKASNQEMNQSISAIHSLVCKSEQQKRKFQCIHQLKQQLKHQ